MSKITKCDMCGALDDGKRFDFGNKYRVPVKVRQFSLPKHGYDFVDVDVCCDCLKLLKEKAEEVMKND